MNDSAELPTHALLYFKTDHTVCTLPVKRILQPPQLEIVVGCSCIVRWSVRKQYAATVLYLVMIETFVLENNKREMEDLLEAKVRSRSSPCWRKKRDATTSYS